MYQNSSTKRSRSLTYSLRGGEVGIAVLGLSVLWSFFTTGGLEGGLYAALIDWSSDGGFLFVPAYFLGKVFTYPISMLIVVPILATVVTGAVIGALVSLFIKKN